MPQDAVLFCGSVRSILDPFNMCVLVQHPLNGCFVFTRAFYRRYSDQQIWRALEVSHLKDYIVKLGGLEAIVNEGGVYLLCECGVGTS